MLQIKRVSATLNFQLESTGCAYLNDQQGVSRDSDDVEECHDDKNMHGKVIEAPKFESLSNRTFSNAVNSERNHAEQNDERADDDLSFRCRNFSEA